MYRLSVVAKVPPTHNLLIKLDQFGHKLLAHFHSHPGKGADATKPSGTDENFQKRLESAGHLAVMAIFSRDGFIRFVRLDQNFEIEIYGEGVENYARQGIPRVMSERGAKSRGVPALTGRGYSPWREPGDSTGDAVNHACHWISFRIACAITSSSLTMWMISEI